MFNSIKFHNIISFYFLSTIFIIPISSFTYASNQIICNHFWKNENKLISSGKKIGFDVGISPYGDEGLYDCIIKIQQSDIDEHRQIFFGEIGDASYIEIKSGPYGALFLPPIYHGLSPDKSITPKYLRFLPFIVSVRNIATEPGTYKINLHYKDLVVGQVGMRSGMPTIETLSGIVTRYLATSFKFLVLLIESFILFFLAIIILFWKELSLINKLSISTVAFISSILTFFSTAIPRYLFSNPNQAIRISDYSFCLGTILVIMPLSLFVKNKFEKFWKYLFFFQFLFLISISYCLSKFDPNSQSYIKIYFTYILFNAGLIPIFLGILIYKNKLISTVSIYPIKRTGALLIIAGSLMSWDMIYNVFLFSISYEFFHYYIYYFLILFVLLDFQTSYNNNEKKFYKFISKAKELVNFSIINDDGSNTVLNNFARLLAHYFSSNFVSIIEINNHIQKTIGQFSISSIKTENHKISNYYFEKNYHIIIQNKKSFFGHNNNNLMKKNEEYLIIPLLHKENVIGIIHLKDFNHYFVYPFLKNKINLIQKECSFLFSLFQSVRQNKQKSILLSMNDFRTYPLQRKCEEFFLENFQMSQTISEPAFIVGDLMESTALRGEFGEKVKKTLDDQLNYIFNKFKYLGIIITHDKGDFISITVLNQKKDEDVESAILRCFEIVKFMIKPDENFLLIPKQNGINLPFYFKMAFSQIQYSKDENSSNLLLPTFNLLTDPEIDIAVRVINSVAKGGECIILERVHKYLIKYEQFNKLPPHPLKGVKKLQNLYTLFNLD